MFHVKHPRDRLWRAAGSSSRGDVNTYGYEVADISDLARPPKSHPTGKRIACRTPGRDMVLRPAPQHLWAGMFHVKHPRIACQRSRHTGDDEAPEA